jgi:glycosyltransferase involved in cell wall biosynthesis
MSRNFSQIAVVIPVHNRPLLVAQAIASIQKQTRSVDEIIVVDDASSDATRDEVIRLARQDHRIRLVPLSHNGGAGAARNVGIDSTQAEWVGFLDSDDQWTPEKLERQLEALTNHGSAVASFTGIRFQHKDYHFDARPPGEISLFALRCHNHLGTTSTAIVWRKALKQVGGFDPQLRSCQDWDLWLRLRRIGEFAVVSDPLTIFNQVEQVRISFNKGAFLAGNSQMLERVLSDVSDERERRIIRAHHQIHIGETYLANFKQPKHAIYAAIRSLFVRFTPQGRSLLKRALRQQLFNLTGSAGQNAYRNLRSKSNALGSGNAGR